MNSVKIVRNGVKAEVREDFLKVFLADGWEEDKVVDNVHAAQIMAFDDKDDLEKYVKENLGFDLDKRGNIETIKEKALSLLKTK